MIDKHNIELFFKKRLESRNFIYEESDWQALEKRLDFAVPIDSNKGSLIKKKKNITIISVAASIAFILGWFSNEKLIHNEKSNTNEIVSTNEVITNGEFKNINESNRNLIKKSDKSLHNYDESNSDITKNTKINTFELKQVHKKKNFDSNLGYTISNSINNKNYSFAKVYSSPIKINNNTLNSNNNFEAGNLQKLISLNRIVLNFKAKEKQPKIKATEIKNEIAENEKYNFFKERWSVGLSFAPDINSVGIENDGVVTPKIGGYLYFSLFSKWTISTGIIYNNKKYNTTAENYNPGNNYWNKRTLGNLPSKITGSCRVVDIPIILTYKVFQKNKVAYNISAGVSSYILQDEYYEFEFEPDVPLASKGWETSDNTMSPFSIGNFSVGFEMNTSKRTRLAFEPFVKIPLKDIGWGNIRLYSYGIQINLKYKL